MSKFSSTKKSVWVKLLIIVVSVTLSLGVILGGAIGYFRLPVSSYYKASKKAFVIPKILEGYVPQGLAYDNKSQTFILSGYMNDHSPSPVFMVSEQGELQKTVYLKDGEGKDYTGHGGGIAVSEDYIYLAGGSDYCVYAYKYSDFINAEDGEVISPEGSLSTKTQNDQIQTAFVTVNGNRLIVGEFYRAKNYPTLESHKLTTNAGDFNQAIAVEFVLDNTKSLGIDPTPVKAYSIPDLVQGLEIYQDKIYLSTSWGLSFSHIYVYQESLLVSQGNVTILDHVLPLYAMDSASLIADYKIAPMSEEMAIVDGLLYVNCESASNKYLFGRFTGGKWLYATDLSKIK